MALTKSQLQKLWRARRDIKARFFENLNRERQGKLAFPKSVTDKPEGAALAHFFVNYPRCRYAPAALALADGVWVVAFDEFAYAVETEAAAALVALREVSSLPVTFRAAEGPLALSQAAMLGAAKIIEGEVRDMRDARMWGAQ